MSGTKVKKDRKVKNIWGCHMCDLIPAVPETFS